MLDTVERLFATTRIQLPESSRDMVLSRVILVCDWSPKPVDAPSFSAQTRSLVV
jgi:hypothetical protein